MAFTALFTHEPGLSAALGRAAGPKELATVSSWPSLIRLVRERPVTTSVLDAAALPPGKTPVQAVLDLRSRFTNLGLVILFHRHTEPLELFHLGRAGLPHLVLLEVEDLGRAVPRALQRAEERGATAMVTRALSPYLPRRELRAVRLAMEGVHQCWSADDFASAVGLSRPFLSERLKACGLPSAGHLLIWARLLHAGLWLEEPGRTGESVSRQLEYSSGAAFRRSLKLYTGATPTEVARSGGLRLVLDRMFDACGLAPVRDRVTAA